MRTSIRFRSVVVRPSVPDKFCHSFVRPFQQKAPLNRLIRSQQYLSASPKSAPLRTCRSLSTAPGSKDNDGATGLKVQTISSNLPVPSAPGFDQLVHAALNFNTFSPEEIKLRFEQIDTNKDGRLSVAEVQAFFDNAMRPTLESRASSEVASAQIERVVDSFMTRYDTDKSGDICPEEFKTNVLEHANTVDKRVYPIAFSMFLALAPIGIIIPLEPILVKELSITVQDFGIIIASFALSKFAFNITATNIVECKGRKSMMIGSLGVLGISVGAMGFATCTEHLIACRLLTGVSVAGLASSIMMSLTDLSTALNRAKTMSTLTSFINAGIAIGPAAGGLLASWLGMRECFFLVGGAIMASSLASQLLIQETMMTAPKPVAGLLKSHGYAFSSWGSILRSSSDMRLLSVTQAVVSGVQGGAYGTLLPLFLSNPPLDYTTAMVGALFAGFAGVGVVAARPLAALADKYGRIPAATIGLGVLGSSVVALPLVGSPAAVTGVLATWALGSNIVSPALMALAVDSMIKVDAKNVQQGLSLLRTSQDIGMLVGATSLGAVSLNYRMPLAFECSGGLTFAVAAMFAVRAFTKA